MKGERDFFPGKQKINILFCFGRSRERLLLYCMKMERPFPGAGIILTH
jgi:hypothetical protein